MSEAKSMWSKFVTTLKGLIIGVMLGAAVVACTDKNDDELIETHNREGIPMVVTVVVYDDLNKVTESFREFLGDQLEDAPHPEALRKGWSYWTKDGSCTIHVAKHNGVNDEDNMETWGHELTHCVYGKWHAE